MARLTFPSDRLVYLTSPYAGAGFVSAAGKSAVVYSDSAGTVLADVQNFDGTANSTATFTIDANSELPLFLGPAAGSDTLYVKVTNPGSTVVPLYAITPSDVSSAVSTEVTNRTAADAAHVAASDPHGDRAAATTADTAHVAASDPHGDRAAATTALNTETTARQTADIARLFPRGAWVTGTVYAVNDEVTANGVAWRCIVAHTAGATFSADPTKWERFGVGQVVTTAPSSPATDDLWYDKANDLWKRWSGTAWKAEGSGSYLAVGAGVGRIVGKLASGTAVTVTAIGDSILAGATVTADGGTPGVDDCLSQLCTTLASRFGVTVTKNNRAVSGSMAYSPMTVSWGAGPVFTTALADTADLYVISFGHNDLRSDSVSAGNLPGIGFAKAGSWRAVEHMIRRIRADVPTADILLMTESPYNTATDTTNPFLVAYNVGLQRLAAHYGCEFVDCYSAIKGTGAVDTYIIGNGDPSGFGNHPNTVGHHLMGATLLTHFPASSGPPQPPSPVPALPESTLFGAERYDRRGWTEITTAGRVNGVDGYRVAGTWTNSAGAAPQVSSTATDFAEFQFIGSDCFIRLDTGSGQGVVKIVIDGVTYQAALDLSVFGTGQSYLAFTGLGFGYHRIVVTIVSGSVTLRGFGKAGGAANYTPYTSAKLVFVGTWAAGGADASFYQGNSKFTATTGDTVTFDFIGTGFALDAYRYTAAGPIVGLTIDGVAQTAVDLGSTAGVAGSGGVVVASGLEYGRHTVVLTAPANAASRNFQISGVFAFDERQHHRPRAQRGLALVADVVTYPVAFAGRPALDLAAADGTSTTSPNSTNASATGFTAAGTAAALAQWRAEGGRVCY